MKIDRLYTLGQLVDDNGHWSSPKIICDYNDLLKQPLTKEMFVNPYSNNDGKKPNILDFVRFPEDKIMEVMFSAHMKDWQAAEKKVIFDDDRIEVDNDGVWFDREFAYFGGQLKNLSEISRGEIKLKNLEV